MEPRMSERDKSRILQLAGQGYTTRLIADRLDVDYDRVRAMIVRAIKRGELPAGTLEKCKLNKKPVAQAPETPKEPEVSVYAPSRIEASRLGKCLCCGSVIDAVLRLPESRSIGLCRIHASELGDNLHRCCKESAAHRARFNGAAVYCR